MDKGLATPKFLYRKHMGCWLHPRTLGMHLRQLRIDVYMYKYICIQNTKHTSICIDLVFVVALGGPSNVWIHINLGWIWRLGSPFGGPWGWHFGGSFWFGGTLHWVLLLEIRLWGAPPGRVKKQLKHRFLLRFTNRVSRTGARLTVRRWVLFVRVGQGALVPFWGVLGALGLVLQWPIYLF